MRTGMWVSHYRRGIPTIRKGVPLFTGESHCRRGRPIAITGVPPTNVRASHCKLKCPTTCARESRRHSGSPDKDDSVPPAIKTPTRGAPAATFPCSASRHARPLLARPARRLIQRRSSFIAGFAITGAILVPSLPSFTHVAYGCI